jgi:hypothetical protein
VFAGIVVLTLLTLAVETATPWLMNAFPNALPTEQAMQRNVPMKLFILVYSAPMYGRYRLHHCLGCTTQ